MGSNHATDGGAIGVPFYNPLRVWDFVPAQCRSEFPYQSFVAIEADVSALRGSLEEQEAFLDHPLSVLSAGTFDFVSRNRLPLEPA